MLLLIGCVPDILTVYSVGDGSYGVEPSGDCLVCSVIAVIFALALFVGSIVNK